VLNYAEQNEIRQEMRRLLRDGALPPVAAQYFSTPRPYEQLFDTQADPEEVTNLADDPHYSGALNRLRTECDRWMLGVGDAQLVPEPLLEEADERVGNRRSVVAGEDGQLRIRRLLEVTEVIGRGATTGDVSGYLSDEDPAVRWWAAMGLGNTASLSDETAASLRRALNDKSMAVRVAVARALDRAGHTDEALPVLTAALNDPTASARLWAITVLDEMDERARPALEAIRAAARRRSDEYVMRVAIAALRELEE
jgi:uncharacterized sulfatase